MVFGGLAAGGFLEGGAQTLPDNLGLTLADD